MEWPNDTTEVIHMSDTLSVSLEELEKLIKARGHSSYLKRPVIVEYLDLRWFFKERKNFIAFSLLLAEMPDSFFTAKFTALLLE